MIHFPLLDLAPQYWIAIAGGVVVLLALLFVLLYFTVFSAIRYKNKVRELSRKFEYNHALLFGEDSQKIKRLENISQTNLLYVNTHATFVKRYKDIRDKSDALAQEKMNELKDLLSDRNYKELKLEMPKTKAILDSFEADVNALSNDLISMMKPEEDSRQQSLLLKEKLRKIKQDYYVKQADLSLVTASFERCFSLLDDRFTEFDNYVESAQYEEADALLPKIGKVIDALSTALQEMPNLCVSVQSIIPDKLASLQDRYEEMTKAGYPLHHLINGTQIEDMRSQVREITTKLQNFELQGLNLETEGLLARIDDYFSAFDKEKDARVTFEAECEQIYHEDSTIENRYIHLCNALPDVKRIYTIPTDEQEKIDDIKALINKAGATKRSLDTLIHSGSRQPYSLLVERMHSLRDESAQANAAIEDFNRYLMSLKDDSEDASRAMYDYDEKLHDAEVTLRTIDLPVIQERYGAKINELFGVVDEIKSLLKAPVDVRAVTELSNKLKSEGDEVCNGVAHCLEKMYLADVSIAYAARFRSSVNEARVLCHQAENLYYAGDFDGAYQVSTNGIKTFRSE